MDKSWYLDLNRLARHTRWAHGIVADYFERLPAPVGIALLLLAALTIAGWLSARRDPDNMTAVLWCALGALVAFGVAEVLVQVLARPFPYQAIKHVEVLVPRARNGVSALPSSRAALGGAVVVGLALARRWRLAGLALLAAAVLCVSGVYVGIYYPSDVAAGAGLGIAIELVLWPLGAWVLGPVVASLSGGPFEWLVASSSPVRKPGRPLVLSRPASRLPNARAMDALRVASEAARQSPPGPTTTGNGPGRTPEAGSGRVRVGGGNPQQG